MSNTIMTAKNGWSEGLVMDFSPTNTSANSLTSALNATLVTMNGNDMQLQNDMGNARVETAYLPEGYVPVGTCEFGDIIYVVSYNPISNKSQIGCFPSPERNISSEETGNPDVQVTSSDFQEANGELKTTSIKKILYDKDMHSGDQYVIYSTNLDGKYLSDYGNASHTHGKFPKLVKIHVVSIEDSGKIVYLDSTTKWYNNDYYVNTSKKEGTEEPDLDSYRSLVSSAYSVFNSKVSGKLALLIELEKITGFSCSWVPYVTADKDDPNYSIYSIYWNFNWTTNDKNINISKVCMEDVGWVEGAQIAKYYIESKGEAGNYDLPHISERISYSISRTYSPENNIDYKTFIEEKEYSAVIKDFQNFYKVNIKKQDDNGYPILGQYYLNYPEVRLDKYQNNTNDNRSINDDIINNYFNYPVFKGPLQVKLPTIQEIDNTKIKPVFHNVICKYTAIPAMPYGKLREFQQTGYIDFSKIGTKNIKLHTWRYYNYENTMTLTWGMDGYVEQNKGISEVVFEFYDNYGFVAAYHNKGKLSYNGTFTEYIVLNESNSNYKLTDVNYNGEKKYHPGIQVTDSSIIEQLGKKSDINKLGYVKVRNNYHYNDAGTIYSNCLYLVKIITKYCNKNIVDELDESSPDYIVDYRWIWTNNMFNEYYHNTQDFKELQFTLGFDANAVYEIDQSTFKLENFEYNSDYEGVVNTENMHNSLSATVQHINQGDTPVDNVKMAIRAGLQNDYGTFNLKEEGIKNINVSVYLANQYLETDTTNPDMITTNGDTIRFKGIDSVKDIQFKGKLEYGYLSSKFNKLIGKEVENTNDDIYSGEKSYENYKDTFNVTGKDFGPETENSSSTQEYINYKGEVLELNTNLCKSCTLDTVAFNEVTKSIDKYIPLQLSGVFFSKYYYLTEKEEKVGQLRSFVLDLDDLRRYNIVEELTDTNWNKETKFMFDKALFLSNRDKSGKNAIITGAIVPFYYDGHQYISRTPIYLNAINSSGKTQLITSNDNDSNTIKDGGEDTGIDVHTFLNANIDTLSDEFKFLFPMGFGYVWGSNDNTAYASLDKNKDQKISSNKLIKENTTYSSFDLSGTLCGIVGNGNIEPGQHYTSYSIANGGSYKDNILRRFVNDVMHYLTQFFYIDDTPYKIDVPSNIVYLNKHNLIFTRDVVIKLNKRDNANQHICMRGIKYDDYLDTLIKNVDVKQFKDDIVINGGDTNVKLVINGVLKNCPLQFHLPYIKPLNIKSNNYIQVKSIFDEIPNAISEDFAPNAVYHWNFNNNSFESAKNTMYINKCTYDITEDDKLKGIKSSENISKNVVNQAKTFAIENDSLAMDYMPTSSNTGGLYNVYTNGKSNKASDTYLSNFINNLKYYSE